MPDLESASDPSSSAPNGAAPWLATRQGRYELAAAGLFLLLFTVVPLVRTELYPFSRAPMFADAPREYCEYSIVTSSGEPLGLLEFGLQRNYWGNPIGVGVGFEPPTSLDDFGQVADEPAVKNWVGTRLNRFPQLQRVSVTQRRIGPIDDRRVGECGCITVDVIDTQDAEATK